MPDFLAVAGLHEQANKLRSLKPYEENSLMEALELLETVRIQAQNEGNAWHNHIAQAAFWGQGALVAAAEYNSSVYEFCLLRIQKECKQAEISRYPH